MAGGGGGVCVGGSAIETGGRNRGIAGGGVGGSAIETGRRNRGMAKSITMHSSGGGMAWCGKLHGRYERTGEFA